MKKSIKISIMICALLIICATMNAPPIFAQESKESPQIIQPSPNTDATPTPTPIRTNKPVLPALPVPAKLQNEKFVQVLLATIEYQNERNAQTESQLLTANGQIKELQGARDEWKGLFFSERAANGKLQTALAEERFASGKLREANLISQNQRELDKSRISDLETENKSLRRSRWKYAAVGFLGGFATGVPTGGLIAVKFNF